jgi:hypothetical protein
MGDTPGYATSILAYDTEGSVGWDNPFWEFGHLLWRPIGHGVFHVLRPFTSRLVGDNERLQLILALMIISWTAGLFCVVFFRRFLSYLVKGWIADVVVVGVCFSNAFLNYSQTGCAYVSGLLLLILGMTFLLEAQIKEQKSGLRLLAGSAVLAGSVCLWFPYILVIPAALLVPMILHDSLRVSVPGALKAGFLTATLLVLAYVLVLTHLGIFTLAGFKQWMVAAGHGYNQTGLPRMVFGLARSFVNMGDDGILFKRYLLRDPFNPVGLLQLVGASLWKLVAFYLAVAVAMLAALSTASGRRGLILFGLAAAPILYFALFVFEGGMPERYLPLLPFLFLLFAISADSVRIGKYVIIGFVVVMTLSDTGVMSKWALRKKQEAVTLRVQELSLRLKPDSLVAATHLQDDLTDFYYNYPFNPINRHNNLTVYNVLEPGAARILTWKEDFAAKAQATWKRGGEVWISKRFFAERPRSDWNWTEGDDRRISWTALAPFFKEFEVTASVGGDDGFVLLPRTLANEKLISELSEKSAIHE